MVTNRIIFFATSVQPNPEEIDYWVDLSDNPYGGSIKYFNGTEWVRLAASGGMPDLSNYYTKTQVNKLLNDKANVSDVDSKVDDEEVKDVIKDIQFNTSNPNGITMVMFKYDGSNKTVSIPVASTSSAGIITSKDFLDFVKQHQLQELHTEMIDTFADIRAKYQKKLIAGLNIEIDQETNVISASGDLAVQWDNITNKPDFKPVATSGDYNDLINKLKPGKDVSISEDNTISIAIDSDSLEQSLATLQSNIDKEAATARAAETKLGNDIATEKNRAQSAEQTISTNLQNEIDRSTQIDTQHTNAINKEVQDRKEAIATEVSDRNAAILVETNRAKAKEEELDNKITDHTNATNAALALKADKSDTYTKAQVDAKLSGAYKVKGSSTFEALPKDNNVVGDVYNITNAFNLGGKHYDAGTNVVWTEEGWDALSGSFDTTAIEGSIQEVADNLAQEILDRTQADTTINNNISSLTNRVKVNEDKLTIINGNESTTGSIANAIKQAKSYTDTTVTAEQTRAENAEQKLTSDLASEVTRAKGAESANATAIANEVERATGVEETLNSNITQLQTQKVDKVEGKGLSTNDYTTPEKNKLAAIEAEANKYVLPAATTTTLGGIIVGDRLSIDDTGKLVATYTYTLPTASNTVLGGVKIGSNITNTNGTISLTKANVTSALGVDPTNLEEFDWYGVSWSETSSNPDCTRIGNMDMHRSLPIQSMMKPFIITNSEHEAPEVVLPMNDNFNETLYGTASNQQWTVTSTLGTNVMIKIPEFWYTDEYTPSSKTHNLKICPHAKPGWHHHKEAYVSAYEAFNFGNKGRLISMKSVVPTVNFTRTNGRTWARANGFDGEAKWNLYTYEEHRAICHLFLVEYATRNSQKAVNTALTPEGFRQGGLGSGCTTGTVTINGAQTWSFIPTGSSDSLGSGSGEVTVTIQQTDSSGSNTSTITRKCNRYRGIENPFGHIWKHTDDIISIYEGGRRTYYKSIKPDQFATNKNNSYKPLTSASVTTGYKTEIRATPTCDFFAEACTNGSETTYWCDYNWDNTDASEHCLLIGGHSGAGGAAGLFYLHSANSVGYSRAAIGSRLTYLPWAE